MEKNRKLAHIVAYYLSRFNEDALNNLGYKNYKEAFTKIGDSLAVKPNYIKFRRDEFDVEHPRRQGWHKRPMTPSVADTINALRDISEPTLREMIQEIIRQGNSSETSVDIDRMAAILPSEKEGKKRRKFTAYIPRGITGRKAEEIFLTWFEQNMYVIPEGGMLSDVRDSGCGYDFELIAEKNTYYFEVKGMSSENLGGLMLTDKEWSMAKEKGDLYYLVVVVNVDNIPFVNLINNPAKIIRPRKNLATVIQVTWSLTAREVQALLNATDNI